MSTNHVQWRGVFTREEYDELVSRRVRTIAKAAERTYAFINKRKQQREHTKKKRGHRK
jgi:hypothetical protein